MNRFNILLLMSAILFPTLLVAQSNGTYMDGVQLFRQAKYEEAYVIFSRLLREDPSNYPVFDQTITTLVHLKRYEEAIEISRRRLRQNYADIILATRLAELYHLNGEIQKAYEIWDQAIQANQQSVQAYRFVADNMYQRREYSKAIEVYLTSRQKFNNNTLFFSEITTNYMALGQRENAASTLLDVLTFSPGNSNFVLRQIIQFDDSQFTEISIVELDERLRRRDLNQAAVVAHREVLIGLLMEQGFYRRALTSARTYEPISQEGVWPVFTLAQRLKSLHEFTLADDALDYYIRLEDHPIRARALEERAVLYMTWAEYITEYNLPSHISSDSLLSRALESLDHLLQRYPSDSRRIETLSLKSELLIDHTGNTHTASLLLEEIRKLGFRSEHQIISEYVDGRIQLALGNHSMARLSLTRANRDARTGELAEKSRYFLALNDFYAGDFEFSAIQMRALERLTTSYYANDALKLRVWMSEGMRKDSVTQQLRLFAQSKFLFDSHQTQRAVDTILPLLVSTEKQPLLGDAVLMVTGQLQTRHPMLAYQLLVHTMPRSSDFVRERLRWEQIRMAERIINSTEAPKEIDRIYVHIARSMYQNIHGTAIVSDEALNQWVWSPNLDRAVLVSMYEDLLYLYPNGFYAQQARERLFNLQSTPS